MSNQTITLRFTSFAGTIVELQVRASRISQGLALHRSTSFGELKHTWSISHVSSGKTVMTSIRSFGKAEKAFNKLLCLADWTKSGEDLAADKILQSAVHELSRVMR